MHDAEDLSSLCQKVKNEVRTIRPKPHELAHNTNYCYVENLR